MHPNDGKRFLRLCKRRGSEPRKAGLHLVEGLQERCLQHALGRFNISAFFRDERPEHRCIRRRLRKPIQQRFRACKLIIPNAKPCKHVRGRSSIARIVPLRGFFKQFFGFFPFLSGRIPAPPHGQAHQQRRKLVLQRRAARVFPQQCRDARPRCFQIPSKRKCGHLVHISGAFRIRGLCRKSKQRVYIRPQRPCERRKQRNIGAAHAGFPFADRRSGHAHGARKRLLRYAPFPAQGRNGFTDLPFHSFRPPFLLWRPPAFMIPARYKTRNGGAFNLWCEFVEWRSSLHAFPQKQIALFPAPAVAF